MTKIVSKAMKMTPFAWLWFEGMQFVVSDTIDAWLIPLMWIFKGHVHAFVFAAQVISLVSGNGILRVKL